MILIYIDVNAYIITFSFKNISFKKEYTINIYKQISINFITCQYCKKCL